MKPWLLALALLAGAAAVPEPNGFRLDKYNAPVPDTLHGATVLHTQALIAYVAKSHPILIDVVTAPRRPEGMAPGAVWLPLPHKDIPGSIWLPDVGRGDISPGLNKFFATRLKQLTQNNPGRALVFYCRASCWMSWNAARRALQLGEKNIVWYPDGVEGWQQAGQPLAAAPAPATP